MQNDDLMHREGSKGPCGSYASTAHQCRFTTPLPIHEGVGITPSYESRLIQQKYTYIANSKK